MNFDLFMTRDWSEAQAETQFLGANLSHELGALLLTETISHSISNDLPVFCLFLDARSAFDLTIREITIRKLHLVGTTGQRLLYIDNRLKHRETYMEWDKKVLGPIKDEIGFEQGGISSSDLYMLIIMSSFKMLRSLALELQSEMRKLLLLAKPMMWFSSPMTSGSWPTSWSSLWTIARSTMSPWRPRRPS